MYPSSIDKNEEVPERPKFRSDGTAYVPLEPVEWWREFLWQLPMRRLEDEFSLSTRLAHSKLVGIA